MTWQFLLDWWGHLLLAIYLLTAPLTCYHAVTRKSDDRAAIGWVGLVLLSPLWGTLAYWILGVNRVRRAATLSKNDNQALNTQRTTLLSILGGTSQIVASDACIKPELSRFIARVHPVPLLANNSVELLIEGDVCYPKMLAALNEAKSTIALMSYIFDSGKWGDQFVEALYQAKERGVEVRVLIDAVGARYSPKYIPDILKERGIPVAIFNPSRTLYRLPYLNLRNHRKLLCTDGRVAFIGGMNIRDACVIADAPAEPVHDIHFAVQGGIIAQLMSAFAEDWSYATGEVLEEDPWFQLDLIDSPETMTATARVIPDGPDEDIGKLRWALLGAIHSAQRNIWIQSPYFIPDDVLLSALSCAAMRGVDVTIIVPAKPNIAAVGWASQVKQLRLLETDCKVWYQEGQFSHAKWMTVDDDWSFIGSANWDPRSMRLNFELNIEVYDKKLATELVRFAKSQMLLSRRISKKELSNLSVFKQLRNGLARLFSPYL